MDTGRTDYEYRSKLAVVAGIFSIIATIISGYIAFKSSEKQTSMLEFVDVVVRNNDFDIKIKNLSEYESLIKEL